jgi:hypothetical protein
MYYREMVTIAAAKLQNAVRVYLFHFCHHFLPLTRLQCSLLALPGTKKVLGHTVNEKIGPTSRVNVRVKVFFVRIAVQLGNFSVF